jgi:hypothetical protein
MFSTCSVFNDHIGAKICSVLIEYSLRMIGREENWVNITNINI